MVSDQREVVAWRCQHERGNGSVRKDDTRAHIHLSMMHSLAHCHPSPTPAFCHQPVSSKSTSADCQTVVGASLAELTQKSVTHQQSLT